MNAKTLTPIIAFCTVPAFIISMLFAVVMLAATNCGAGGSKSLVIDPATVPNIEIDGYGHEQLVNAAYIIKAGADKGLTARDQTIGVMTAMGESTLRVLDYGDEAGPDSRGLFQQRDGWGTLEERMDPYISAGKFFDAMVRNVPDPERQTLEPTLVAHRTQINADPYHYERFWDTAVKIAEALSGADTGLAGGAGQVCSPLAPGTVNAQGWAAPASGPLTDTFGPRAPIWTGGGWTSGFHRGVDFDSGCESPIWAAQAGTVTMAGFDSYGNGTIWIDHGNGLRTRYLHMFQSGMLVREGDAVTGGQQIARVGNSGQAKGCHLHFEIHVNGEAVDPIAFMAAVGISLG